MSQHDLQAPKRRTLTKEEVDRLVAEPFDNAMECATLCRELQFAVEQLNNAHGNARNPILARIRAINQSPRRNPPGRVFTRSA